MILHQVCGAVIKADVFCEDTRQQHADNTAYSMTRKYIQRIVEGSSLLIVYRQVTDDGCGEADKDALPKVDKSCCGCDCHKAHHRSDACAHRGNLAADQRVKKHPRHHRRRGSKVGRGKGLDGEAVRGERRARVKTKPTKPQHARSQDNERDVRRLVEFKFTFPQYHSTGQCCKPSGHVYDRSTREVEYTPLPQETIGMPRPVC